MNRNAAANSLAATVLKIVNYFKRSAAGDFLFCACDSRPLIRHCNRLVVAQAQKDGLTLRELPISSDDMGGVLARLRAAATDRPGGIIITNLDSLIDFSTGAVLAEINLAREALVDFGLPLLFWLSRKNMAVLANLAQDLFSRRGRGVIDLSSVGDIDLKELARIDQQEMTGLEATIAELERQRSRMPVAALEDILAGLRAKRDELAQAIVALNGNGGISGAISGVLPPITGVMTASIGREATDRSGPDPDTALRRYRQVLFNADRYLPLRGVDIGASDPDSGRPRMELARVYVELKTKSQGPLRAGQRLGDQAIYALEATIENRHLVLLGDPGSGKTTFLNHLGLCLAGHVLDTGFAWLQRLPGWPKAEADIVPIHVVLRDFARSLPAFTEKATPRLLWRFIVSRLEALHLEDAANPMEDALAQGRALVLLDGLDEIPSVAQRTAVRDALFAFAGRYPRIRLVVTCRVLSYQDPAWQLAGFPVFELAPFDHDMVAAFIDGWYAELSQLGEIKTGEGAAILAEKLKQAIERSDLRRLAANPLLLTVMALVHTHMGRLPRGQGPAL